MAGQPNQVEPIDTVGTWDYVLFVIMLGATLGIGIFHAVKDWRQRRRNKKQPNANVTEENTKEYFAGGHKMNVFAISMSMIATYVHSNLILGYPAEIYYYGAQYWLYCVGQALGAILAIVIFVPVFYPLQMTSVNHYFMLRFDSLIVQWIGMFCSAVALLFLTGVTLFGPATALEAVTDIPDWGYIVLLSIITVFYTTLGGFKAVIWTDVFQSVVMVAGMIAIVAKGIHEVGDMSDIWDIYSDWDRDDFFDFTGDPTQRLTFWGLVCGVGLTFMGIYGSSQVGVQRYSSLSTRRKANISVLSVIPGSIFFTSLACLSGVVIFAYFAQEGCDPLFSRQIKNPNQIVPYFLMRVLNQPGVPGIFLAAMCAGALSTASSCLNSSAANIWEDFLEKVLPDKYKTDFWVNIISKLTVVFCGIVAMCLAFVVMGAGGTLTQAFGSFAAGMGGPVVGLFLMGLFNPWANWKGACVGTVIGMTFTLWVAIGSYTIGRQKSDLPLPRDTCPRPPVPANGTSPAGPPSDDWNITGIEHLYTLTFLWFKEAGSGITILIGTIVSLFTGPTDPATIHPCLLHPVVRWILRKTGKLMSDEESARSDPRTISEKELKGVGNAAYAESTPDVSKVANGFHGDSHTNGTDVFPQGTYTPYTSTSV